MKRICTFLIALFLILPLLCACSAGEKTPFLGEDQTTKEEMNMISYRQITAQEAKEIMDTKPEYVVVDARTDEEFAQGHIAGAILIPEFEIALRAEKEIPDKNALILVYCRSGRRSKIASEELVKLGYTNVLEFGGIIDWPYEVVE